MYIYRNVHFNKDLQLKGEENMFCIQCGKEIPDGSAHCPYCGAEIKQNQENIFLLQKKENQRLEEINFVKFLLLGIVTCGIYIVYTYYKFAKTVNKLCDGDGKESPNYIVVLLLGMITLGIYTQYWMYTQAERLRNAAPKYNCKIPYGGIKVLLWGTFGNLIIVGPILSAYYLLKSVNLLIVNYNQGIINERYVISQYVGKKSKPILILLGYYGLRIILIGAIIGGTIFGSLGDSDIDDSTLDNIYEDDENIGEEETKSEKQKEKQSDEKKEYLDASVEQLQRKPDEYDGKAVRLQTEFMILADTIVTSTDGSYIEIKYDGDAYDKAGNAIGKVLSGDSGYVEGTFVNDDDSPYIKADKIVLVNTDEGTDEDTEQDVEQTENTYILPNSDVQSVTSDDLKGFTYAEAQMAINEIYARHGRKFNDSDIQEYFDSQNWYHGTIAPEDFDEALLSQVEKNNIDFISAYIEQVALPNAENPKNLFGEVEGFYTNLDTDQVVYIGINNISDDHEGILEVGRGDVAPVDSATTMETYYLDYISDGTVIITDEKKGQVLRRGYINFYEDELYLVWDTDGMTGTYIKGQVY